MGLMASGRATEGQVHGHGPARSCHAVAEQAHVRFLFSCLCTGVQTKFVTVLTLCLISTVHRGVAARRPAGCRPWLVPAPHLGLIGSLR